MAVAIRLKQFGSKNKPCFRIVACDLRKARDGRILATLGHYNPRTEPATIVIDDERVGFFLENGAQPSETVASLLRTRGFAQAQNGRWQKPAQA